MQFVVRSSAFAALLMAVTAVPTTAQVSSSDSSLQSADREKSSVTSDEEVAAIETLDEQLVSLIENGTPEQRSDAIEVIINLKRQRPDAYEFSDCISPLTHVYRSDQEEGVRLLALVALDAIGTTRAYEGLRQAMEDVRSNRLRRQTALVLEHAAEEETAS